MPVAVGMHNIVIAQDTDETAVNFRALEDQLQFRNARYNIVSRIELVLIDKIEFLIDSPMDFIVDARAENDVPVDNKFSHLLIVEQNGFRRIKLHRIFSLRILASR